MRQIFTFLALLVCGGLVGFGVAQFARIPRDVPIIAPAPTPKPLLQYTFANLANYVPQSSLITLDKTMDQNEKVTVYLGSFTTGGKRMSMQIMVPQTATPSGGFPVILMNRGFVDPSQYQTGIGTKNAAKVFAAGGFVTVAPDFLGFGASDAAPEDTMAARLEKPQQLLDLIASLPSFTITNPMKLGLWGHSNGGQITLSLLEITQEPYPTVLWAPVTKPFPYSLLYYTDEYEDGGKALRQVIANFEKDYDVFDYSIDKFSDRLVGPIELHQGTADDAVPEKWSRAFTGTLKEKKIPITYYVYEGADHNLQPAWQTAVNRSLVFFKEFLYRDNE